MILGFPRAKTRLLPSKTWGAGGNNFVSIAHSISSFSATIATNIPMWILKENILMYVYITWSCYQLSLCTKELSFCHGFWLDKWKPKTLKNILQLRWITIGSFNNRSFKILQYTAYYQWIKLIGFTWYRRFSLT